MPLLINSVGAERWGHFALAQSVAMFVTVLVSFGWGATGPSTVAAMPSEKRPQFYVDSFIARSVLYLCGAPMMTILLALLLGGDWLFGALAALSLLLPGVGGSWYFIGESRPARLLLLDALPQMIGTVAGTVSTLYTGSMTSYFIVQLAFNFLSVLISLGVITYGSQVEWSKGLGRRMIATLWGQRHGVWTTTATTLYVTMPSMLVQAFLPGSLSVYAFAERLYRYASVAYSPIQQFLQGWVPAEGPAQVRGRVRSATVLSVVLGVTGAAAILLLSGTAAEILTGGQISIPLGLVMGFAVAFFAVTVSGTVGLACLVALHELRALSVSSWSGAAIGVPALFAAAAFTNATTVGWAVALAELTVAIVQVAFLRRAFAQPGKFRSSAESSG